MPTSIERVYTVSDIHGHLAPLQAVLELVDLDGDPAAELVLLGNHDDWLLAWLDSEDDELTWLMSDVDLMTVKSFLDPVELAHALGHDDPTSDASSLDGATMNRNIKQAIVTQYSDLLRWLRSLPRVRETKEHIFVHAGVNEEAGELWRAATPEYVFTEKYPASLGLFPKTIIAGHVRTHSLHAEGSNGVFHDGASHWYIDGAVEVTGRLNVLRYDVTEETYEAFNVG